MTLLHIAGLAIAFAALPAAPDAMAHPLGAAGQSGLVTGIVHPLGGLDHLLAMVAVGMLAAQRGGRAVWGLPAAFLAMMAVGSLAGLAGLGLPWPEPGIAASVVLLGALVAFGARLRLGAAAAVVGLAALFHGHAHGIEGFALADGAAYLTGVTASTAALHASGVALGLALRRSALLPGAGGAVAAAGLVLGLSL